MIALRGAGRKQYPVLFPPATLRFQNGSRRLLRFGEVREIAQNGLDL
jgi:hypothetical protein